MLYKYLLFIILDIYIVFSLDILWSNNSQSIIIMVYLYFYFMNVLFV